MRMRHKKNGAARLAACAHLFAECPEEGNGIASSLRDFGRETPLALEIGCGKGSFACGMAAKDPDVSFYAMERVHDVMVLAAEKAVERSEERRTDNLRFILADANDLDAWFLPHSLDAIYLNFSDPWPKAGYKKRRLTHRRYLRKYHELLKRNGLLRFKTDNRGLFDFTLEELQALGITPEIVSYDLHNSEYAEGNVMTEYEANFSALGTPICFLSFRYPDVLPEEAEDSK